MEPPGSIDIIIVCISIFLVAMLSCSEAAMIAVNKLRIRNLKDKGDKRAAAAQRILDEHDSLFGAVILSGNLFTVLATSTGTAMAVGYFGADYGILAATAAMTFLTVVFGELAPKTFGVTHSERVSLAIARPLETYIKLISPLVWIFRTSANLLLRLFGVKDKPSSPFVTEDEIKTMLKIGQDEGAIEEDERKMLHRVFEFGDKMVSEAMVPRTEMVSISQDASTRDAIKLVSVEGYSRFPIVRENIDNTTGILYIKDLLIKMASADISDMPVSDFRREAYYIPESKMISELLDEMQKNKFQVAIVMDEYGGTAGMITLEDIIEEIVGEFQDEFEAIEAEKDVEVIDERTFVVVGQTGLDEVNELVGSELVSEEFNTLAGFVFGLFGRLPSVGEQVRYHSLRFLVIDMDGKKLSKIKITKL